uniref:Uncharacterized protein n=1 Tax=Romanomermis culicivorax TaxID=13658 RepID=A0A915IRA6_ROMCU
MGRFGAAISALNIAQQIKILTRNILGVAGKCVLLVEQPYTFFVPNIFRGIENVHQWIAETTNRAERSSWHNRIEYSTKSKLF